MTSDLVKVAVSNIWPLSFTIQYSNSNSGWMLNYTLICLTIWSQCGPCKDKHSIESRNISICKTLACTYWPSKHMYWFMCVSHMTRTAKDLADSPGWAAPRLERRCRCHLPSRTRIAAVCCFQWLITCKHTRLCLHAAAHVVALGKMFSVQRLCTFTRVWPANVSHNLLASGSAGRPFRWFSPSSFTSCIVLVTQWKWKKKSMTI